MNDDTLRHDGGWSDQNGVVWRHSTLTDAERDAVSRAYSMMLDRAAELQERAATFQAARPFIQWAKTLQGLFERLGGEK